MPVTLLDSGRLVRLTTLSGDSRADILLYGATVLRSTLASRELLFLSDKAALDGSAAVRGGIPVVFPLFGNRKDHKDPPVGTEKLPKHGFARTETWEIESGRETGEVDSKEGSSVTLVLDSSRKPHLRDIFPFDFVLRYKVTLSTSTPSLNCELRLQNKSNSALPFQALLHSYLRVPSVSSSRVLGVSHYAHYDKVLDSHLPPDAESEVSPGARETDRVYAGGAERVTLAFGEGKGVHVDRETFKDTVVWNPGEKTAAGLKDLHEGGWKEYVCVEPGSVRAFESLEAGKEWRASQTLTPF